MANSAGFVDSVIQITVLAAILAHYPAREGRGKMSEVLRSITIRTTTSPDISIHVRCAFLLHKSANNTFRSNKPRRINRGCALRRREVTQAVDGFAIARAMISKLRPLKLYNY